MAPDDRDATRAGAARDPHALERAVLGEDPTLTAAEVAEHTGVPVDRLRRLWWALGFPEHGTAVAFTPADVEAVSTLDAMVEGGAIDFDISVMMTRALGQSMARLADWEVATLAHRVEELERSEAATGSRTGQGLRLVDELNPAFEGLVLYAWRRHLAAALARIEAQGARADDLHTTQVSVGFADIVGFTALSNELSRERIGDIVEIFESRCADVVAGQRGRIIKSLGDSVLFVSAEPVAAYDIAEGIIRDRRSRPADAGGAGGARQRRRGDAARRRVRAAGQPRLPAHRRGPAQPDHHRPGHGRPAARGPVRDPAAPGPPGARVRPGRAADRTSSLVPLTERMNSGCFATHRRRHTYGLRVLTVQDVRLDPATRRVWRGEREIGLSRKEFELLHALMASAGTIVSRDELMREVWDTTFWTSSKTIDVHLGWLRRKLGDDSRRPDLITTVRGRGLRFEIG